MRSRFVALASAIALVCIAPACSDSTAKPRLPAPANGGLAKVVPKVARAGESVTVTPSSEIEPVCTGTATVLQRGTELAAVGYLNPDGLWQPYPRASDGSQPTFKACEPLLSAQAVTYTLPTALGPGEYTICMEGTQPVRRAVANDPSCGAFTVLV
jgi:hypothetical protein